MIHGDQQMTRRGIYLQSNEIYTRRKLLRITHLGFRSKWDDDEWAFLFLNFCLFILCLFVPLLLLLLFGRLDVITLILTFSFVPARERRMKKWNRKNRRYITILCICCFSVRFTYLCKTKFSWMVSFCHILLNHIDDLRSFAHARLPKECFKDTYNFT